MKYGRKILFLVLWFFSAVSFSGEIEDALQTLQKILNLPGEEIRTFLTQYESIYSESLTQEEKQSHLFNELKIQKWGVSISEFKTLSTLLFSFLAPHTQTLYRNDFYNALNGLETFRKKINHIVKINHPGYRLRAQKLQTAFQGDGITIAVFDLFDANLLNAQRHHYSKANIQELIKFGNPVSDSHGNSVLDIILTIAPHVTILPISAETTHYNESMTFVLNSKAQILNMSRAFPQKNKLLDKEFSNLMSEILKKRIVTKSLGNTGTDLDGKQTPIREEKNLPPLGNPFSYDLQLIKEFLTYKHSISFNQLLLAVNLNLLGDNLSLTTTVPGEHPIAINQSFAISADGVYSWSTDNYESGSSFAAPQLAAISALLWQACQSKKQTDAYRVTDILKLSAIPGLNLGSHLIGLGELNADTALKLCNI